jgi:predicted peroxiredoxin
MANKLFYVGLHGSNDPTQAVLPFLLALGAKSADIDVQIGLIGEGVYLMKDDVAKTVVGVGFPPLNELLEKTIAAGIPIYI